MQIFPTSLSNPGHFVATLVSAFTTLARGTVALHAQHMAMLCPLPNVAQHSSTSIHHDTAGLQSHTLPGLAHHARTSKGGTIAGSEHGKGIPAMLLAQALPP